jgi:integrase
MKLTQKTIVALALPDGRAEAIHFDDDLPGFGLRIRAGGSRSFIFQFKVGAQNRRMTLGSATALTTARAREIASELHAQVRLGRDPSAEKAESKIRAGETMAAVLENYLAFKRVELRPRSYVETERHLVKNAKPLHGLQLAKITRRDIASRISVIAVELSGPSGNRLRAALSAFFAWAMREGLIDSNPVVGTNRWDERSRERVLSNDELKIIWHALGDDSYSDVIRMLMLTGQRLNEIGGMQWSEIIGETIVLPPSRCKNNRQHVVPLPTSVRELLNRRSRNGEFIFGRTLGRPFGGWAKCKAKLDQRIKEMGGKLAHWTHHDLRRTVATKMADELGIAPHIIEAILNHISGHKAGVAGIYNRASYTEEKKRALQRWADYIEEIVSGKQPGKVVQLRA